MRIADESLARAREADFAAEIRANRARTGAVAGVLALLAACGSPKAAAESDAAGAADVEGDVNLATDTGAGSDVTAGNDSGTDAATPDDTLATDADDAAQPGDAATDATAPDDADAKTEADADVAPDSGVDPDGCALPKPVIGVCTSDPKDPCKLSGGTCTFGLCLAPKEDPKRWDNCGDGTCASCESNCPVDCGQAPTLTGAKDFSGDKTISIWVHGFSNQGADKLKTKVYGAVSGCGDVLENTQKFGNTRECGNLPGNDKDPNQMVSLEYYGAVPPPWMTAQDIADVEKFPYSGGPTGLQRYATITAKFVKWRMTVSGATHVNMACHSMGCLITRQMIENDYEGLASSQKISRWVTATGVVDGAQLAWLFNEKTVQDGAKAIGLELSDFILMNPDYVWDNAVWWDHKLYAANNPLFTGLLIHHIGANDPAIKQAFGISVLDSFDGLGGKTLQPNDGIMYTEDEYFHDQNVAIAAKALSGEAVKPTRTYIHADHMNCPGTLNSAVTAAAALFHHRKVVITVEEVKLIIDRESHALGDGEDGVSPAEIVVESETRFTPYLTTAFPNVKDDLIVSDDKVKYRTSPMWQQNQGDTTNPNVVVFSGPVFDDMKELKLDVWLNEADTYPKFKLNEVPLDILGQKATAPLVDFHGQVALTDNTTFSVSSKYATAKFKVRVYSMY